MCEFRNAFHDKLRNGISDSFFGYKFRRNFSDQFVAFQWLWYVYLFSRFVHRSYNDYKRCAEGGGVCVSRWVCMGVGVYVGVCVYLCL